MAGNPLVPQGTLNLLRASLIWDDLPELNVTPPFLAKGSIALAFEGEKTVFIDTMTGGVTSPQPYQRVMIRMNLVRTQPLADAYKTRGEKSTLFGNCTVRGDSAALSAYQIINCGEATVQELNFAGQDPVYATSFHGYYPINSDLWNT